MTNLYILFFSSYGHTTTEMQPYSDVAGPSTGTVNMSTSPAQKAISRKSSTMSTKSSSAKSDVTSASKNFVSQKVSSNTCHRVFQQRNVKASMNM